MEIPEVPEPIVLPPPPNPDFYDPDWDEWKEPIRWPAPVAVFLVVLALIGVYIYHTEDKKSSSATTSPVVIKSPTPTTFAVAAGTGQPADQTFSGSTSTTTSAFTAPGGLGVFSGKCECQATFGVTVLDSTGTTTAIPINSQGENLSGSFSGSVGTSLPQGSYTLKVAAKGPWTLSVSFPTNVPTVKLPLTVGSVGPSLFGPFPAGQALKIVFGFYGNPNPPAELQVINADGTPGEILWSQSIDSAPLTKVLPAQAQAFYLSMSDIPSWWTTIVSVAP